MKRPIKTSLKVFMVELLVYGALVAAYYLLVLHFLGNGLMELYRSDRRVYAFAALGLIVSQGFLLEVLTRLLLAWIPGRTEEG